MGVSIRNSHQKYNIKVVTTKTNLSHYCLKSARNLLVVEQNDSHLCSFKHGINCLLIAFLY